MFARLTYVNKMDIMGAVSIAVVSMMKDRLQSNAVPIQLPIGAEDSFRGIIDLVDMKAYIYLDDLGEKIDITDIPEDMKEQAQKYHDEMGENVASCEVNEDLMMKYLEGEELTIEELKAGILQGHLRQPDERRYLRYFLPQQRACRSCWTLLWTICLRLPIIPAIRGVLPGTDIEEDRHASDNEAVLRAGLQDRYRPLCGENWHSSAYIPELLPPAPLCITPLRASGREWDAY